MFPRGLCPDRDWCCVNSAQAVAPREHALLVLLYRIIDEKWAQSFEHQLLCQTVQVNVDIGNYVVLGLICTLYKLIWEAIAGDTSLITPPPPPSGFKPGVQTSNPACSLDQPWCHVMDQNHNIPDCPTFWCYNNTNINWMARRAFLSLSSKINSNRPNQWWDI